MPMMPSKSSSKEPRFTTHSAETSFDCPPTNNAIGVEFNQRQMINNHEESEHEEEEEDDDEIEDFIEVTA